MGLVKFNIFLDQPVYYSGQLIAGRLVVEVDEPMPIKAIYLKYSGEATVHWTERHRRNGESRTTSYNNSERYISLQQLVFGNNDEDCELPEGEHVFLFQCQLPTNLPDSFEGIYGRIKYCVKATIDRPWKLNHVTKQPITVLSIFDLNHNVAAPESVSEKNAKTFWGHAKQPLFMSINLPVRGYVPGQIIPIKVFLNNESGVRVNSLYVSLKQNITFHAITKSKDARKFVFQNEFPVPEGFGKEEVSLNLQLPALPPSYLEFCKIIDLKYQLNVTAKVDGWYHRNLKIRTEIIIGNIPVLSYQMPIPIHAITCEPIDNEASVREPPAYGLVVPSLTTYQDLPPPTYEESVKLKESEKDTQDNDPDDRGGSVEFSPVYPVYKFASC